MRKIVVTEFVSLDGVMENPAWTTPYWNDEIAKFKLDELFASDLLLLGRVTYQGFAAAWPSRTDEEGFADRMNNLPKFVVSTTLEKVEWNNSRLIKDKFSEEITELKNQTGQNILVYGSADLVDLLRRHNLVDEYQLLVYPLILGNGKRLFKETNDQVGLKLVDNRTFSSGVLALSYIPDEKKISFS